MANAGAYARVTDLVSSQAARSSAATTINTTSDVDITGCTVTFTVSNSSIVALVWSVADFNITAFTSQTAVSVTLYVDGAAQTGSSIWIPTANSQRNTIPGFWQLSLASGSHTVKLMSRLSAANLTASATQNNCAIGLLLLTQ